MRQRRKGRKRKNETIKEQRQRRNRTARTLGEESYLSRREGPVRRDGQYELEVIV